MDKFEWSIYRGRLYDQKIESLIAEENVSVLPTKGFPCRGKLGDLLLLHIPYMSFPFISCFFLFC